MDQVRRRVLLRIRSVAAVVYVINGLLVVGATQVSAEATFTQTYAYSGSTETFTVPPGVTSLAVMIRGGQGGRGGTDSAGPSPAGGYAGQVQGTIAVTPGEVLTIAVGSGAGSGAGGGNVLGGGGGTNPLPGYDGGTGGSSGDLGYSGSGGGGGAASVIRIGGSDIVAGGAGGSGGSGQFAPIVGRLAEDHFVARADITTTNGRNGLSPEDVAGHSVDGGGSGAGGAGAVGGEHGADQYGGASATEWFGFGGYPGSNSFGGYSGLLGSYQYYAGNNAAGSITLSYILGVPDPPRSVVGVAGNGSIDAHWLPPQSEGAAPITDYIVKYSTSPVGPFSTVGDGISTDTHTTITGLTNGTPYYLQVIAVNSIGESLPSSGFTFPVTPSASAEPVPLLLHAIGGDSGASLQWSELSSPAEPVIDYLVEYATGEGGPWNTFAHPPITDETIQVTGLTNGTPYLFRVAAVTASGHEPFSNAASATPLGSPSAPTIQSITPMSSAVMVAFDAPANDGGLPITGYEYQLDGGEWIPASQASSPLLIGGLSNGQTYSVTIRAVTSAAVGAAATPASAMPYGLPGMVPDLAASPGASSVTLDWDAAAPNGSPVTSYNVILWSAETGGSILGSLSVPGTDHSATFTGLGPGIKYFTVEAGNAAGFGPRTPDRVTAIVGGVVPEAPSVDSVQALGTSVTVDWTSGVPGSAPVSGYRIRYVGDDGDTAMLATSSSPGSDATVTLPSMEPYHLEIAEYSAAGMGAASSIRPPMAQSGTATVDQVAPSVDLNGTANANGSPADLYFEIATTEGDLGSPGSRVGATPGGDSSTSVVALTLADHMIEHGTTYYFRAVAISGTMTAIGETRTFTTESVVSIGVPFKDYDGEPIDVASSTEPEGLSTAESWVGVNGTAYGPTGAAPSEAGEYRVTLSITSPGYIGSGTFDVMIDQASQIVAIDGVGSDAHVGDVAELAASSSAGLAVVLSVIGGAGSVCDLHGSSLEMTGPGRCVIQADQSGTRNYEASRSVLVVEVLPETSEGTTPAPDPRDVPSDTSDGTSNDGSETPEAPSGTDTGSTPTNASASGREPTKLAYTGTDLRWLLLLGASLVVAGACVLVFEPNRRRREAG